MENHPWAVLSGFRRIQTRRLHGRCCHIYYSLQTYQRLPLLREFRFDNFILPCFTTDFNSVIVLCRNFSGFGESWCRADNTNQAKFRSLLPSFSLMLCVTRNIFRSFLFLLHIRECLRGATSYGSFNSFETALSSSHVCLLSRFTWQTHFFSKEAYSLQCTRWYSHNSDGKHIRFSDIFRFGSHHHKALFGYSHRPHCFQNTQNKHHLH